MNTLTGTNTQHGVWSGHERRKSAVVEATDVRIRDVGKFIFRYGLAFIFVSIGLLKFTAYEAENIEPFVANSPIWSWAIQSVGLRGVAGFMGVFEILIGVLIAIRVWSPKLSAIGSLGAVATFIITLSFMLTTPGVWEPGYGFGFLSAMPGQFLVKDIVLLGVSIWTAGEAFGAAKKARPAAVRST